MGSTVPGSGSRSVEHIVENARAAENDVAVGATVGALPLEAQPPEAVEPERAPAPLPPAAKGWSAQFSRWGALVALALVLAASAWAVFRTQAAIALDVGSTPSDSLALSGLVLYGGEPVQSGIIHLAVSSSETTYHLASVTLSVKEGRFSSEEKEEALRDVLGTDELRIDARFWGIAKRGAGTRVVETSETVYSNCSTPITREDVSVALALFTLLSGFIIVLFTMELTQSWARMLFATSYLATFLSVTLPLVAISYVSQNPYLTKVMEESPFGLVRARTLTVEETQWLLNVGGLVEKDTRPAAVNAARKVEAAAPSASNPAGNEPAASAEGSVQGEAIAPAIQVSARASAAGNDEPLIVRGGLAIPFYVIILAIFGAGINMMRRIPAIQAKHVKQLATAPMMHAISGPASSVAPEEAEAACNIRQAVIEQHMYLLAAPFLAIAVYYLLQILANDIAQPVIVLMSFSAGLISERIVAAVIGVAGRTLGDGDGNDDDGEGEKDKAVAAPGPHAGGDASP